VKKLAALAATAISIVAFGCKRPVDGRSLGATLISEVEVRPKFIRANVPVEIDFRASGAAPVEVSYEIAGVRASCSPMRLDGGKYRCVDPGLDPQRHPPGGAIVLVETVDDKGRRSSATAQVTIDFECPHVSSMRVLEGAKSLIVGPGRTLWIAGSMSVVQIQIDASEELSALPEVSRQGVPWGPVIGEGRSFVIVQQLDPTHGAAPAPLAVRLVDLAGNTSDQCGQDVRIEIAVDHQPPAVDPRRVSVIRGAAGELSTITASTGAFVDDVAIRELQLIDQTSGTILASFEPRPDGSLPTSGLRAQPPGRVVLRAIDHFDLASPEVMVEERWSLSLGDGSAPGSAIRTAVRVTPPPADSAFLHERTADLAADVRERDGFAAEVTARTGFERVGSMPNFFEDRYHVYVGYDPKGHAMVAFGGAIRYEDSTLYSEKTTIMRWDEANGEYFAESGPTRTSTTNGPTARRGLHIAFDDQGCGVIFAGEGLIERPGNFSVISMLNEVWQICLMPNGNYTWRQIRPSPPPSGSIVPRIAPLIYDPRNRRYIAVQGLSGAFTFATEDVLLLEPDRDPTEWSWQTLEPLPADFGRRWSHFLFWDPRIDGFALGSGDVTPFGSGEHRLMWTYRNGQWTASQLPRGVYNRLNFGWAFDEARSQLVFWGGDQDPLFSTVWFLTKTSTNGADAWREVDLDAPVPRLNPSMVYDADREVVLVFGGRRADRFVPPDLYQIISQPSWPYLQATIALGAARPAGIDRLRLHLFARAVGDLDGVGEQSEIGEEVEVFLWDTTSSRWENVARGSDAIEVDVRTSPDRFISRRGTVSVLFRPLSPTTEAVEGRLIVDAIDGELQLRSSIPPP
jgi:hypothetical protein